MTKKYNINTKCLMCAYHILQIFHCKYLLRNIKYLTCKYYIEVKH